MTNEPTLRYPVVLEPLASNWSGWVPDIPGCVATAQTQSALTEELRDAIAFHLDGLAEDGIEPPPSFREPITGLSQRDVVTWVEVPLPHAMI